MRHDYKGYLKPWLPLIETLAAQGCKPQDIARELFRLGVRSSAPVREWEQPHDWERRLIDSMAGLIRGLFMPDKPRTIRQRRKYWHVWTPERQRAEFDAEF